MLMSAQYRTTEVVVFARTARTGSTVRHQPAETRKKQSQTKPLRLTRLYCLRSVISGQNKAIEIKTPTYSWLWRKKARLSQKMNGVLPLYSRLSKAETGDWTMTLKAERYFRMKRYGVGRSPRFSIRCQPSFRENGAAQPLLAVARA